MHKINKFVTVIAVLRTGDADIVRPFVREAVALLDASYSSFELILVDDCSGDRTVEVIRELLPTTPCVRLIRLTRSFGYDIAISAGLDSSLGDYVVALDPGSDPVELIPRLVELADTDSGVIIGECRARPARGRAAAAALGLLEWLAGRLLRVRIGDYSSTLYVFSRQATLSITRDKVKGRYLPTIVHAIGFARTIFSYEKRNRRPVPWVMSFNEQLGRATTAMLSNSVNPLRFATYLGLFASSLNLLYALYVVLINVIHLQVIEGWTSLSLQVSGLFFFTFCIFVMISEYLGHILAETRDRPLYFVLEEHNSTGFLADEHRNVILHSAGGDPPHAESAAGATDDLAVETVNPAERSPLG